MSKLKQIGKKYFTIVFLLLLIINIINYSGFEIFTSIRMNVFFSGFFGGFFMAQAFIGIAYYNKLKK